MPDEGEAKRPVWLTILLALIPVLGLVLIGYWQFVYKKPRPDRVYAGRVRDDRTDQPIHKAKVSIEEDQKPPQVQETDSEGVFRVKLSETADDVHVVVEAPGYEGWDRRVAVKTSGLEYIRLRPGGSPAPTPTQSPTLLATPSPTQPAWRRRRPPSKLGGNCNAEDVLQGRC